MEITAKTWQKLHELAKQAIEKAYVPYSRYGVGAAAVTTDGRFFTGCNIENASYGVTLCAECTLVSGLIQDGGGRLAAFVCVDNDRKVIVPCGRCRQLLFEHGGNDLLVEMPKAGVIPMSQVLPEAFGPEDLENTTYA